ncbi:hypothetical protein C8J56DRAFT_972631 [Mycena floridula]|nr:hypothetical protein C8J56DRAFT_972631 [Mycena floridula]
MEKSDLTRHPWFPERSLWVRYRGTEPPLVGWVEDRVITSDNTIASPSFVIHQVLVHPSNEFRQRMQESITDYEAVGRRMMTEPEKYSQVRTIINDVALNRISIAEGMRRISVVFPNAPDILEHFIMFIRANLARAQRARLSHAQRQLQAHPQITTAPASIPISDPIPPSNPVNFPPTANIQLNNYYPNHRRTAPASSTNVSASISAPPFMPDPPAPPMDFAATGKSRYATEYIRFLSNYFAKRPGYDVFCKNIQALGQQRMAPGDVWNEAIKLLCEDKQLQQGFGKFVEEIFPRGKVPSTETQRSLVHGPLIRVPLEQDPFVRTLQQANAITQRIRGPLQPASFSQIVGHGPVSPIDAQRPTVHAPLIRIPLARGPFAPVNAIPQQVQSSSPSESVSRPVPPVHQESMLSSQPISLHQPIASPSRTTPQVSNLLNPTLIAIKRKVIVQRISNTAPQSTGKAKTETLAQRQARQLARMSNQIQSLRKQNAALSAENTRCWDDSSEREPCARIKELELENERLSGEVSDFRDLLKLKRFDDEETSHLGVSSREWERARKKVAALEAADLDQCEGRLDQMEGSSDIRPPESRQPEESTYL